jgi:hypothetical protein
MMKAEAWVKKAVGKKDVSILRPELGRVHEAEGSLMATDGTMAMIWHDPDIHSDGDKEWESREKQLEGVLNSMSKAKTKGRLSKHQIVSVCKAALALGKPIDKHDRPGQDLVPLKFSLNGNLEAKAEVAGVGSMSCSIIDGDEWPAKGRATTNALGWQVHPVIYKKIGPDVQAGFDPKYLLKMLDGMGDEFEYAIDGTGIWMKSGQAEAVLMALNFGRPSGGA